VLDELCQELGFDNGCLLERNRLSAFPVKASSVFGSKFQPVDSPAFEQKSFNLEALGSFLASKGVKSSPFILLNEADNGELEKSPFKLGAEISANGFDVMLVPLLPIWSIDYVNAKF